MYSVSFPVDSISGIRSYFCPEEIKDRMVSPWRALVFIVYQHLGFILPIDISGKLST
jgi:hypothetical protein